MFRFPKVWYYPYNPDAIDCSISTNNPAEQQGDHTRDNEMNGDEDGDGNQSGEESDDQSDPLFTFSAEKDQLF